MTLRFVQLRRNYQLSTLIDVIFVFFVKIFGDSVVDGRALPKEDPDFSLGIGGVDGLASGSRRPDKLFVYFVIGDDDVFVGVELGFGEEVGDSEEFVYHQYYY